MHSNESMRSLFFSLNTVCSVQSGRKQQYFDSTSLLTIDGFTYHIYLYFPILFFGCCMACQKASWRIDPGYNCVYRYMYHWLTRRMFLHFQEGTVALRYTLFESEVLSCFQYIYVVVSCILCQHSDSRKTSSCSFD